MPLDALWNPGTPVFSAFMPAIAQPLGRGFEGFQYLGLGVLIALPLAAVLGWRMRGKAAPEVADLFNIGEIDIPVRKIIQKN